MRAEGGLLALSTGDNRQQQAGWLGWAFSLRPVCAVCCARSSALSLINLRLQCVQTPSTALVNTPYIYTFGVRAATCYTHVITVNAAHSATAHFRQAPHSLTVSLTCQQPFTLRIGGSSQPSAHKHEACVGVMYSMYSAHIPACEWAAISATEPMQLDSDAFPAS
jgi:hypothetical protein